MTAPLTSAFGFHVVAPLGREARRILADRDSREKDRLAERRSGFERHDPLPNPIVSQPNSAGFITDEDRLHLDVAGDLKKAHDDHISSRQLMLDDRRQRRLDHEKQRWDELYATEQAYDERGAKLAGTSKRNNGSVGYDIVNHNWGGGPEAEKLKFEEDSSKWRACNRANQLYVKGNNSERVNILTGDPLPDHSRGIPPKPSFPPSLRPHAGGSSGSG
eukprot:RCo049731